MLSIGTINELYLALRLSILEQFSKEKMPILLDETFAYFDDDRLRETLKYLNENYKEHQIIIFTCTNREKNILKQENIIFKEIEM